MKKQVQMIGAILIALIIFSFKTEAQVNPFHRIPSPDKLDLINPLRPIPKHYSLTDSTVNVIPELTAFRFTAPMAGYDIINSKIVTGLGFGWNKLHYVDSLSKWYSDISVNGFVFAQGNITPSITQNNIMSVGIGVGIKNNLINIVPCYNLPLIAGTKGKFGLIFLISSPLN